VAFSSPKMANADVTTDGNNLVIQNVYYQPFGVLNLTIPWKGLKAVGLVDLLHSGITHEAVGTIAGVEAPIDQQIVGPRIISFNVGWGSIVSGPEQKGLIEVSANTMQSTPNLTPAWSGGLWIGTLADGSGPWGGYKLSVGF
jgi:hypothetical protein